MTMNHSKSVGVLIALLSIAGCSKPSDRYQGISEPREVTAERSPATRPSVPNPRPDPGATSPTPVAGDTDSPGTTNPVSRAGAPSGVPSERQKHSGVPNTGERKKVTAEFQGAPGVSIEGRAELEEVAGGVRIVVDVDRALSPGAHGLHVHEKPDCSDIPAKSMGGHFAPNGHQHGLPGFAKHHLGDLGNLKINKYGGGELEITVPYATLERGGSHSYLGRALVIHEGEDKGQRSQPAGDSGKPIACAVITAS